MGKTPFKMRGFSGFGNSPMTKKSPAKHDPEATHPEHHEGEEVSKEVYDDPEQTVTSNVLQNIDTAINEHKKNFKETKSWDDKNKALKAKRSAELKRMQVERAR